MSPKKDKAAKAEQAPAEKPAAQISAHGSDQAPFIYFDGPVSFGFVGAIVQIELGASVCVPVTVGGKTEVRNRTVVTAHLRATHAVMANLADAIEKALALTGPLSQLDKKKDKIDA